MIDIKFPDVKISIGAFAFLNTAYYNHPENWENNVLYIGDHLVAVKSNLIDIDIKTSTDAIAEKVFYDCRYTLKNLTINGNHFMLLNELTNLETLILTELPTEHNVLNYFGRSQSDLPLTLKTIILKEGCDVISPYLFSDITDITIFVESEKLDIQWDHDYPGWNNGNRVYYGGEWIEAQFTDANGNKLGDTSYYTTSQIIRQPFVADIVSDNGKIIQEFLDWDLDGDGIADSVPASSAADIQAVALYETHHLSDWIVHDPACLQDGYREIVCLDCSRVFEREDLETLGHDEVAHEAQAPTCTEIGWEAYVTCSRCDYTTYNKLAALSHDEVKHEAKAPTCLDIGWDAYVTCSRCDYTTYVELPATGHSFGDDHICDNCGYEKEPDESTAESTVKNTDESTEERTEERTEEHTQQPSESDEQQTSKPLDETDPVSDEAGCTSTAAFGGISLIMLIMFAWLGIKRKARN